MKAIEKHNDIQNRIEKLFEEQEALSDAIFQEIMAAPSEPLALSLYSRLETSVLKFHLFGLLEDAGRFPSLKN